MKNNPELSSQLQRICVVGENAKSVAATMALTRFGLSVDLYTSSLSTQKFIQRYGFDVPLCEQWDISIESNLLNHKIFALDTFIEQDYDIYWVFLDQLPDNIQDSLLIHLQNTDKAIFLSGITHIGRIDKIAQQLNTLNVFYIPFVFLNQASIFLATIEPRLLLIGEKTPDTAMTNPIINLLVAQSHCHHIDSLKTIEFTRSSMANLVASKLSLINEIARLADYCAVDMKEVEAILMLDERLGKGFLTSGWGYGGSTLSKENSILNRQLQIAELSTKLVSEVALINNDQKELIFRKLWRYFDSYIQNKTVFIWGAGYKTGTGRTKGSAIHTLLPLLWSHNVTTFIFDPLAQSELKEVYGHNERLQFAAHKEDGFDKVDAFIIINDLQGYYPNIEALNTHHIPVFDAKNLFSKADIQQLTAHYTGIGRGIM